MFIYPLPKNECRYVCKMCMIIFDKNYRENIEVSDSDMIIKRELAINISPSEMPLSREVMANGLPSYQSRS